MFGAPDKIHINRAYLSQFENGRLILNDQVLEKLEAYYVSQGALPASKQALSAATTRGKGAKFIASLATTGATLDFDGPVIRDGFLIPSASDDLLVEDLLAEYAQNRQRVAELCQEDLRETEFLDFVSVDAERAEEKVKEVLTLMARNFAVIEEIQGGETVEPCAASFLTQDKQTTGDFLSVHFGKTFGFVGEDGVDNLAP